jgi:large subunit ribosomal protein L17
MRHKKLNFKLGIKTGHRKSLISNLASFLILNDKVKTTESKAKAIKPFIEKIITLSKKSKLSSEFSRKLHYRRIAIARLRNKLAIKKLFDYKVNKFMKRNGGYTRIYKLKQRKGDGAKMAQIEFC